MPSSRFSSLFASFSAALATGLLGAGFFLLPDANAVANAADSAPGAKHDASLPRAVGRRGAR